MSLDIYYLIVRTYNDTMLWHVFLNMNISSLVISEECQEVNKYDM